MSRTIHLLSDETINQIAAGEVIESPASVIKEVIENALDAGAQKITIEITGGGMKLIRVSDDGIGMNREDAHLSIVRHATSKITRPQDLFHISTKGFRGEALASVASISKMTLITAREGEIGTHLEIEKGQVIKSEPFARTRGTTVEVRSLFYNVPARKRFQKTAAAISAEIFRIVMVMSLSHPAVQFELISNGRKAIKTAAGQGLQERAKELLGDEFVLGSFPLTFEEGPLRFTGLVGAPTNSRTNKLGQYLFLNQRAVMCPQISEAVREGYGTRMDERRHPIFLLHLDVPADLVDINVHPQKLHVRLRKEELFRSKVKEAVIGALAKGVETVSAPKITFAPFEKFEMQSFIPSFHEVFAEAEQGLLFEDEGGPEILGQVDRFLFLKEGSEAIILDLQAAQYRVLFENLLQNQNTKIEKQRLLIPFTVDLNSVEAAMILSHLDAIEGLGFELRSIGRNSFMVEAIPPFAPEGDIKEMLTEMAHQLQEFIGKLNFAKERQKRLASCASRFVKSKTHYSNEEGMRLYEKLRSCESPLHCPKGNPTLVVLNEEAIESLFRADFKAPKSS